MDLNQSAFQPILKYFIQNNYPATNTFISIKNSKSHCISLFKGILQFEYHLSINKDLIDCAPNVYYADIGWVSENRNYLQFVRYGICLDGRLISMLNSANCALITTTTSTTTPSPVQTTTTKRNKKHKNKKKKKKKTPMIATFAISMVKSLFDHIFG